MKEAKCVVAHEYGIGARAAFKRKEKFVVSA